MIPSFRFSLNKSFLVAASLGLAAGTAHAATIYKAAAGTDISAPASFVTTTGTTTPTATAIGATDTLYFDNTMGASLTALTLGGNLTTGALRVDGTGAFNVAVNAGNTLTLNGNNDYTGGLAQGIVLNSAAGGTLTLNNNVAIGVTQRWVSSRALTVNGGVALGANNLTLWSAGVNTGNIVINGVISGSGQLLWDSGTNGKVALNGANTYTGGTTLGTGTLNSAIVIVGNNAAFGAGTVTANGVQIQAGTAGLALGNAITVGAGGLSVGGANAFTLSGPITGTGATTIAGNALTLGGTFNTGAGAISVNGGASTLIVAGSATTTGSLNLGTAAGGTVTVNNGGTLNVGSINNNWGANYVVNGTMNVTGGGAWNISTNDQSRTISGTGTINASGNFQLANYTAITSSVNTLNIAGSLLLGNASGQTGNFTQSAGTTNVTTTAGGSIRIGHWDASSNTSTLAITGGTFNATGTASNIGWDGNGALSVSGGAGNFQGLLLGRNGSKSSTVNLSGGTLNVGAGGIASAGSGTKVVNLGAGTLGSLAAWNSSLAMNLTSAAGTTVDTTGGNIGLSGALTGAGKLIKTGAGTLTLTGNNAYTGGTTVNAGTLTITAGTYAGATTLSGNGSVLTLDYTNGVKRFTTSSTLSLGAAGAGNFNTLNLNAGSVADAVASTTLNGNIVINRTGGGSSTLNLGNLAGGGVITLGTAGIVKTTSANGAGGFISSGVLLKVGGTTSFASNDGSGGLVQYGTLPGQSLIGVVRGGDTIGGTTNTSVVSVGNGVGTGTGVITLGTTGTTDVNVILIATDSSANGGASVIDLGGNTLRVAAAGGITQLDSVAGTLTVQNGTLTAGGAANTAGTLSISNLSVGQNIVVSSAITNNGGGVVGLTKNGPGTLVLTGANTYTGTTTIAGGILQVGNGGATGALGSGNVVFNGGNLVFNTTGGTTVAGAISGTGTLTAQAGTVVLTGANSGAWGATIASGATLQVGNGGATGTLASGAITTNGTLAFNSSAALTVANTITGTGAVVKNGGGTVAFSTQKTYTGGTTVNAGILDLTGGGGASGVIRGTATVNSGGTLRLSTGDATGYNGGANALTVINLAGGTLNVNTTANQTLGAATINLTGGSITGIAGSNLDFSNPGSGDSSLHSFSSSTTATISGTKLNLRQGNGVVFTVDSGTTASGVDLDIQSVVRGANPFIKSGAGKLALSGTNTFSGPVTVNAGTLQIGTGGGTGTLGTGAASVTVALGAGASLVFNTTGTNTVGGVISGAGSVNQIAAGTLTLSGSNTYTGGTIISAGTVNLSGAAVAATAAGSVGTGALTITGVGTVVNTTGTFGIERRTDGTNNRVINIIGGTLNLAGAEYLGTVNLTGGTLNAPIADYLRASGAGLVFNSLAASTTSTINNRVDLTQGSVTFNVASGGVSATGPDLLVAGVISENQGAGTGAKTLTKTGAGTMALTGENAYTGATTISGGTLQVGNAGTSGRLGSGAVVNNASLVFKRVDAITVANAISGTGTLTQTGSDVLTLAGSNTYNGLTTVSTGTIRLGAVSAFNGAGAIAIASGAIFDSGNFNFTTSGLSGAGNLLLGTATVAVNTAGGSVFSGVISGSGGLFKTGVGTLVLSGANDYTGTTVINGGTLQLGNGGASGSIDGTSSLSIGAAGTLAFNRSGASDFALNISGAGDVTQQGPANSVVTLKGNNTYTGLTHVVSGTLKLGSAAAFGGQGAISIDAGATFDIGANAITLSTSALSGAGTLNAGAGGNLTVLSAVDSTFAGSIAGFGNFIKGGTGNLTLTGTSNNFTGTLNINSGSLILGGANGSITNNGGTVNVTAPGALVFDHTAASTFGANITGTGGLTQQGAGATTITGLVSGGVAVTTSGSSTLTLTNAADLGAVTNSGTTTLGSNAAAKTANTATVASVTNTAGTLTVSSNITGAVAVTGGALVIGADHNDAYARLTGATTTVGPAGKLTFGGLGSYSVTGITVTGAGIVEQAGSSGSTITLTGANAMAGTATVRVTSGTLAITDETNIGTAMLDMNAGTLRVGTLGDSGVLVSSAVNVVDNKLSYLVGNEDVNLTGTLTGAGAIRFKGPGLLTVAQETAPGSGLTTSGAQIIRDGGTLDIKGVDFSATNFDDDIGVTNNGATLPGGVAGPANFVVQQNQDGTVNGLLSDGTQALGLVKNGAGTLTLALDNTYTGGTTINAGTLRVGTGGTTGSAGTGAITINTAGTLAFDRSDDLLVGNIAASTGTLSQRGAGLVTLTANTAIGNLTGGSDTDASIGRLALGAGVTLTVDTSSGAVQSGDHYAGVLSGPGSLVKSGAGTLVLSGNSTLTTTTTVTGGTLRLGNGGTSGSLGTGDVALTGGTATTLQFDRSDTAVFAGKITGSGSLSQVGTGTLVLTNRNTYSGKTLIGAGSTLQVGDGTTAGDLGRLGGGVVTNSGTLVFRHTDDITVSNSITGTGDVIQRGSGSLTLTGTNVYTGETRVVNGKLILNTASLSSGRFFSEIETLGGVTTTGTLVFSGTGAGTVQNGISGNGHVLFTGSGGVTMLKGSSSGFNGDMNIASGHTLQLGVSGAPVSIGSGTASLIVQLGGKLTGTGTVNGSLKSFGTVAPGFSPGLITVAGDFTTLGSLNMEIAGPGAAGIATGHDQVNYGGVATLGGTLNVNFTNGFAPAAGYSTTLLQKVDPLTGLPVTTAGSINGNFSTVNVTGGTGRIITASDAIIFFNGDSLAQIPGMNLHDGVSAFADALSPTGSSAVHPQFAAFLSLNQRQGAGALAAALQNASPVGLAALTAMPTQQASRDAEDVRRRAELQTMAAGTPFGDETDWLAYVGGSGTMLDADSGAGSPSFDTRSYGGLAGLERRIGDGGTAIGVRIGYDRSTATLHNGGGKIDQDHARGTLYAITQLGENGYLAGGVGMGYSTSDTKRNTLNGTTQKASPTGWDLSASLDGGYIVRLSPAWSLTPHAGLTVTQANVGGFTERGSDLALAVDGYSQTSAVTRIGTGLYREWLAKNFTRNALRIGVDVSYEHTLFGDTADIPASFAQVPQAGSFKSESPALLKDSVVVGPQIQWVFDESRSITAGYRFQMGFDGSTGQRADISFEQRF